jgi:hypothetical protein
MTHNPFLVGLATAIALSLTAAYAATSSGPSVNAGPSPKKNEFLQVAQVSAKPNSSRVFCYSGLKADEIDNWAPVYRGWICIPDNRR